jgi:Holliday junction resolvasome RuvABC endonuclease subunit
MAAHQEDIPVIMIGAQKAKKRWTGSARAEKSAVKDALLELHPYLATIKPMNQAISDAIAIGLLALELE